jgi:hypothetical protein
MLQAGIKSDATCQRLNVIVPTVLYHRKGIDMDHISKEYADKWYELFEDVINEMVTKDRSIVRGFKDTGAVFRSYYACANPPSNIKSFGNLGQWYEYWEAKPEPPTKKAPKSATTTSDGWTSKPTKGRRSSPLISEATVSASIAHTANPFDLLKDLN